MKTSRGFAPLILVIIIGLVVLGGAGWWAGTTDPLSDPAWIFMGVLSASPKSGSTPLTVTFTWENPVNGEQRLMRGPCPILDFGDGVRWESIDSCPMQTTHTYTAPGAYHVVLTHNERVWGDATITVK